MTWEIEIPKPEVKLRCRKCARVIYDDESFGVVSPHGTEHVGIEGGKTACGLDATGDKWWWPL